MNCFIREVGGEEKGGGKGKRKGTEAGRWHKNKYETYSALREIQGRYNHLYLN